MNKYDDDAEWEQLDTHTSRLDVGAGYLYRTTVIHTCHQTIYVPHEAVTKAANDAGPQLVNTKEKLSKGRKHTYEYGFITRALEITFKVHPQGIPRESVDRFIKEVLHKEINAEAIRNGIKQLVRTQRVRRDGNVYFWAEPSTPTPDQKQKVKYTFGSSIGLDETGEGD